MRMPILASERVLVRPFVAPTSTRCTSCSTSSLLEADVGTEGALSRTERGALAPVGGAQRGGRAHLKAAAVRRSGGGLKETGSIVGACGYVPCFGPFGSYRRPAPGPERACARTRVWALLRHLAGCQGRGLATEAARLLVSYGFDVLNLARIVATTSAGQRGRRCGDAEAGHAGRAESAPRATLVPDGGTLDHPARRE